MPFQGQGLHFRGDYSKNFPDPGSMDIKYKNLCGDYSIFKAFFFALSAIPLLIRVNPIGRDEFKFTLKQKQRPPQTEVLFF